GGGGAAGAGAGGAGGLGPGGGGGAPGPGGGGEAAARGGPAGASRGPEPPSRKVRSARGSVTDATPRRSSDCANAQPPGTSLPAGTSAVPSPCRLRLAAPPPMGLRGVSPGSIGGLEASLLGLVRPEGFSSEDRKSVV